MAQRIYHVPVSREIVALFERFVATDEDFELLFDECRSRARQHQAANAVSKRNARRLSEKAFEKHGRIDDYHMYVSLRPYLITASSPSEVSETVSRLIAAENDEQRQSIFDAELARLPPALIGPPSEDPGSDPDWRSLQVHLPRLRGMRAAVLDDRAFAIEQNVEREWSGGIRVVTEEKVEVELRGQELAEAYGNLAGYMLARLGAYCGPTWWLGRNFWLGLLLTVTLPAMSILTQRAERRVSKRLGALASSTESLLSTIAVPGFSGGLPLLCEGYSSGLYFNPFSVVTLRDSLASEREPWLHLSEAATGYEREALDQLLQMALESFEWAGRHALGVLEADEVVGEYGYR